MLKTITGVYKNGKIEPGETIPFKTERKVIITFLPDFIDKTDFENSPETIPPELSELFEKIKANNKITKKQFLALMTNSHIWDDKAVQAVEQAKESINQWKTELL